jgi:hypothetical protein
LCNKLWAGEALAISLCDTFYFVILSSESVLPEMRCLFFGTVGRILIATFLADRKIAITPGAWLQAQAAVASVLSQG